MSKEKVDGGQGAQNAAEIMADVKAKGGRFREIGDPFVCPCSRERKVLSRLYVGADDEGAVHVWLWVAGHATKARKVAPWATIVPRRPGEKGIAASTACPRCRRGYFFMPGYTLRDGKLVETPGQVHVMPTTKSADFDRVVSEG